MQHENWRCPKCDNKDYKIGEMRVAGMILKKTLRRKR